MARPDGRARPGGAAAAGARRRRRWRSWSRWRARAPRSRWRGSGCWWASPTWPTADRGRGFADAVRELVVPAFADELDVSLTPPTPGEQRGAPGRALRRPAARARPRDRRAHVHARAHRRRYSDGDRRFAEVLAGRVALALDNAGLTSELAAAEEQLGAVVEQLAEAVHGHRRRAAGSSTPTRRRSSCCASTTSTSCSTPRPARSWTASPSTTRTARPLALADLPSARLLAGERDAEPMLVRNVVRATGEERWLLQQGLGAARRRRRAAARRQRDRGRHRRSSAPSAPSGCSREASEALASSLDYAEHAAARGATSPCRRSPSAPCVDMPARAGAIEQVAIAGDEPGRARRARERRDRERRSAALRDGRADARARLADDRRRSQAGGRRSGRSRSSTRLGAARSARTSVALARGARPPRRRRGAQRALLQPPHRDRAGAPARPAAAASCPRSRAGRPPSCTARPASSTRSAATSTTSSRARTRGWS